MSISWFQQIRLRSFHVKWFVDVTLEAAVKEQWHILVVLLYTCPNKREVKLRIYLWGGSPFQTIKWNRARCCIIVLPYFVVCVYKKDPRPCLPQKIVKTKGRPNLIGRPTSWQSYAKLFFLSAKDEQIYRMWICIFLPIFSKKFPSFYLGGRVTSSSLIYNLEEHRPGCTLVNLQQRYLTFDQKHRHYSPIY